MTTQPARKRYKFNDDKLGKLINASLDLLHSSSSWTSFVQKARCPSHLRPELETLPHPAAPLLSYMHQYGVPASCTTPPWSQEVLEERLERGPHKSAQKAAEFIRGEMADFHEKGFWVVLPFDAVRDLPGLRLNPLGSVPQRDRRDRLINDLTYFGTNDESSGFAPKEAMQFGKTLERLLYRIRHSNPAFGPVYMNKIDIANGFYNVQLHPELVPNLACTMPSYEGEPPLVAIPFSLPMGWVESPPAFSAVTETIADLGNHRMHHQYAPPHRLEHLASPPKAPRTGPVSVPSSGTTSGLPRDPELAPERTLPLPVAPPLPRQSERTPEKSVPKRKLPLPVEPPLSRPSGKPFKRPLNYVDIYVDDFCNLVQGDAKRRRMVLRIIMETIDDVLQPLNPARSQTDQEPISEKKLRKGDGTWATRKTVLGWLIDSLEQTVQLPAHRFERLQALLNELRGRKRVSTSTWHKTLGELRSMSMAVPGARGLFSALQTGFRQRQAASRIRIDRNMRDQLDDFEALAQDLHLRPTHLAEIIPDKVSGIGACDASGLGMGGVWFPNESTPLLWRAPFTAATTAAIVSDDNPEGTITNSDLELAGIIGHQDVLAQHIDVRQRTFADLNDNVAALVWMKKGSTTNDKGVNQLLRLAGFHQRHHRCLHTYDHISGKANAMADDASRLFYMNDDEFLTHFAKHYPQEKPWQLCRLRPEMHSALTSCLFRKRADLQQALNEPTRRITPGKSGLPFAQKSVWTPYWKGSKMRSPISRSLPSVIAMDASLKMVSPSDLAQWKTPYAPSDRRWPAWGPWTNDWLDRAVWSTDSSSSLQAGTEWIQRLNEYDPSRYPLSSTSSTPPSLRQRKLSPTCPPWDSSTCAVQANTSNASPATPSLTHSVSPMWNLGYKRNAFVPIMPQWKPWEQLGPQRWSFPTRRMEFEARASFTDAHDTAPYARC